jgi:Ca-activated chloride channel homolog
MRFADPAWLLLLAAPAAVAWTRWRARRRAPEARIGFPGLGFLAGAPVSRRSRWPWLPETLRLLGLALLVVALARPQVPHEVRQIRSKARNIMIALDISSSMKAGDFKPGNRLMVARQVLADFARERHDDLLGLVIFAGRAFLQAPLTPDTELLQRMLGRIEIGMLPDGTAIGTALTMCLTQLKDLPPKASVVVLITDGANNTGKPSPLVAAEAARAIGVRIHTIGVSAADTTAPDKQFIWRWGGRAPDRLTTGDEAILRRVSERSGGRYFRATDPEALVQILQAIDPIERQEVRISETRDYRELYPYVLAPGLLLLAAGLLLGATRLRSVP